MKVAMLSSTSGGAPSVVTGGGGALFPGSVISEEMSSDCERRRSRTTINMPARAALPDILGGAGLQRGSLGGIGSLGGRGSLGGIAGAVKELQDKANSNSGEQDIQKASHFGTNGSSSHSRGG